MTKVRSNSALVFFSLALSALSAFASWQGIFGNHEDGARAFLLSLFAAAIWALSVVFCFAKGGKTAGFLSLIGLLPALWGLWFSILLISTCAFTGSCL